MYKRIIVFMLVLFLVFQFVILVFSQEQNETVAEENLTDTGEKENLTEPQKNIEKPVVSLCGDRCTIGSSCVDEGVQKQETAGGAWHYCGPNHKAETVKGEGSSCSADYECASYTCDNGVCSVKAGVEGAKKMPTWALIGVLAIVVAFLLFRLVLKKSSKEGKKVEKKEEQKKQFWQAEVKGIKPGSYKYRPELDALEKRLKERLKR